MFEQKTLMIVEPGLMLWGSERALAATLKSLTEAWDKVVLVTPPKAELAEEVRSRPDLYGEVEIAHAPIGNLHKLGRIAQLRALVALGVLMLRLRPARVYLNQAGLVRILRPLVQWFGVPFIIHVRIAEDVPRVSTLHGTSRTPIDVIFISDSMEDSAIGAKPREHTRWHNAYDPYVMTPSHMPNKQEAPFVSVGRLSYGKGFHLLIEALAQLETVDAKADIFGAGVTGDEYATHLKRQAKSLNARVRFMGFHSDVIAKLPAYSFLISTSHYEPLGRVIMEGWEAGLVPIVFSGSGGAAEMVAKAKGGLVFNEWSADGLAPVLAHAIAMSEEARLGLVAAGRIWIERELSLSGYRAKLSGVLF